MGALVEIRAAKSAEKAGAEHNVKTRAATTNFFIA
jgi:hypothetical protein